MPHTHSDVDEPVRVVEYDPAWPEQFEQERREIQRALADAATRIEHVGSTAVPGLAGKPIVDLLIGVGDLDEAPYYIDALVALGYQNFGEIFIPGRIYLRKRGPRHFNIALTVEGGEFWTTQLLVRDYLRAHVEDADAYANEKRLAMVSGARMFSTYSQAKGPFLSALIERARAWRRATTPAGHDRPASRAPE